jgi:hypothetical protein
MHYCDSSFLGGASVPASRNFAGEVRRFWRAGRSPHHSEGELTFCDPYERSYRQAVEERDEIRCRHVHATVRVWPAERRFIAKSVDVNKALESVHVSAAVMPRLKSFEPKNAVDNRCLPVAFPHQTYCFSAAKNSADHMASSNFARDPVQSQRGLL